MSNTDENTNTVHAQPLVSLSGLGEAVTVGAQLAGIGPRLAFIEHPDRIGQAGAKVPVALMTVQNGGELAEAKVVLLEPVLKAMDERADGPRRRTGTTRLTDESSFITFINRWGNEHTAIYADTSALGFTAVLDDHPAGDSVGATRWRQHRAVYACPRSPEWLAWTESDGKPMTQVQFGDFIESRLEDLTLGKAGDGKPMADAVKPTDMLAVARQLTIRTVGKFRRDIDPTTGTFILEHKTEHETGSTVIPRAFHVAIPVFEGGERYQLEARVRFTLDDGGPRFSYTLHRRAEVERDAFDAIRRRIGEATDRLVLAGTP